jgi:hypothetical protein
LVVLSWRVVLEMVGNTVLASCTRWLVVLCWRVVLEMVVLSWRVVLEMVVLSWRVVQEMQAATRIKYCSCAILAETVML